MKIDFSKVNEYMTPRAGGYEVHHAGSEASGTGAAAAVRLDMAGALSGPGMTYGRAGEIKRPAEAISGSQAGAGFSPGSENGYAGNVMSGIAGLDMSVQHNYFAVMSNTLSGEDYAKLREGGFHPGDMSGMELETAVDQIKLKLAQAGTVIHGYNDGLDSADISRAAGGSELKAAGIRQALGRNDLPVTKENVSSLNEVLDMAAGISGRAPESLPGSSIRYLMEGELPVTLENLSASLGASERLISPLTGEMADQLKDQMERVIEEAGLKPDSDSLSDASWLIENRIPLTKESLLKYGEIKNLLPLPETDELLDMGAQALTWGQSPARMLLIQRERELVESQLRMTNEANKSLLGSDHYIDTGYLEDRAQELRSIGQYLAGDRQDAVQEGDESSVYSLPAGEPDSPALLYYRTRALTLEIGEMPVDTVASLPDEKSCTLTDIRDAGRIRADIYRKAGESYEALSTQVRRDLGDSIRKAFGNIDEILRDNGLENTEENRRAVRILGYNRMEIDPRSIASVREADAKVTGLIRSMTPAAVLRLIREGKNPLDMSVAELRSELDGYENEEGAQDEKYAHYLLRLEKNGNISPGEREGYIGIYRLFRQVERSDGAVIGSLLNTGAEITVRNLLTAVRSRRSAGMDYRVDDDFGGIESLLPEGEAAIDRQIEKAFMGRSYYEDKNREILDLLDPEKVRLSLSEGELSMQTELDEFASLMRREEDGGYSHMADEVMAADLREDISPDEQITGVLESMGYALNGSTLGAAKNLYRNRGDVFRELSRLGHELHIARMIEDLETEDGIEGAVKDLVEGSLDAVRQAAGSRDMSYEKLRSLGMMREQLSLIARRADRRDYEIPLEIGGELTSVNLKVVSGTGSASLRVSMETGQYGKMAASLYPSGRLLDGYMYAGSRSGQDFLEASLPLLAGELLAEGMELSPGIKVMYSPVMETDISVHSAEGKADGGTENGSESGFSPDRLYKTAKIFLKVMGRQEV